MRLMQRLLRLLAQGERLKPSEAAKLISKPRKTIQEAFTRLCRRGYAISLAGVYVSTPDGLIFAASGDEIKSGPAGFERQKPRVIDGTIRTKAWRAMRIKGKFSLEDLGRSVLDGSEEGKEPLHNIRKYVVGLQKAGYLLEMKRRARGSAPTSNGSKRWMLVRNTGPLAPVIRKGSQVWDQNEERNYLFAEQES